MDAEQGKALVREFMETLHSGDIEGVMAMTTDDPVVPDGFALLAGMVPALFDGTPPTREYTAQYVDGDTVISQITVRGVTKTGNEYQNYYVMFCTFEGDKVAKVQEYMDSAYANATLGLG